MIELPSTTRVAAYPRVSTEEQKRKGISIEAQTYDLQEWASNNNLKIAGFYNDAGNSARKKYNKRPELLRLLEDVRADKIDLIIFTKLDRWFRNIAEYYKVQEILDAHNVQWKAIHEDYDTSTSSGRLKINIMLSVAQDEADRDSERIRAVFDSKRRNLEPVTGHVPTGYIISEKKIVKDPEWDETVTHYFSSFLQYHSIEKAKQDAFLISGKLINYQLADAMLRKKAYYGYFNGVEDMCPQYITKEQYADIQKNRRRTERKTAGNRTYLFTGLAVCAECGKRLGSRSHRYQVRSGDCRERVAYNCPGRYIRNDCNNRVNIGEKNIEEYLLENIDGALVRYAADLERLRAEVPKRNFQEERSKLKKKLIKLKDLYVDDIIDLDLYRKDYTAITDRLNAIDEEEASVPEIHTAERLLDIFVAGWQDMYIALSRPDKQSFWRMAIDSVYIHPTRQITFKFRP